jgi:membrane associated rhomboid family serine protease
LLVVSSFRLSMLFGVLPLYPRLWWQSHLGGLLGGVLAARLSSLSRSRA